MKKYVSAFLLLGLLVDVPAFGQTILQIARSQVHLDLATAQVFSGDSTTIAYNSALLPNRFKNWALDGTGNWALHSQSTDYTYDASGKLLYYLMQFGDDINGWSNYQQITYTYNVQGQQVSQIIEEWDGDNWGIESTVNTVYDANGNVLSETGITNRIIFNYNTEGLLEAKILQALVNGNWENSVRWQYTYLPNDTKKASETTAYWVNNAWAESSRDAHTYNSMGALAQTLSEVWNGASWENSKLFSTSYDPGQKLIFWVSKDWIAGMWVNSVRQFNGFDAESGLVNARREFWDGTSWSLVKYDRFHYSKWVSSNDPAHAVFSVFPNPASTFVILKSEGLERVVILNQQGNLVHFQKLHGLREVSLQLANLPSGSYRLMVIDVDGKSGTKPLQIVH